MFLDIIPAQVSRGLNLTRKRRIPTRLVYLPNWNVPRENPGEKISRKEIIEETGLNRSVVSKILNRWGESGIIDYYSPRRDEQGKTTKEWSQYFVKDIEEFINLEPEEIYLEAEKSQEKLKERELKKNMIEIIEEIQTRIKYDDADPVTRHSFQNGRENSYCLSLLENLGYLEAPIKGTETHSIATGNQNTMILREEFLEPLGVTAVTLDPTLHPKYTEALEEYRKNEANRLEEIQRQLEIYQREKIHQGSDRGERIRNLIRDYLPEGEIKLSELSTKVN